MEKTERIFLEILRAALLGKAFCENEIISPEEWNGIFRLAEIQNVFPMIYEAVHQTEEVKNNPAFKNRARQLFALQTMRTEKFERLYAFLSGKNLFPVAVKGIICRRLYPKPDARPSSDEDLFVEERDFLEYVKAFEEFGLATDVPEKDIENSFEVPFRNADGVLCIELHKRLFAPEEKAYGSWNSFFEGAFERTQTVDGIRTLSHTDHMFYLICHAMKHFLHSGFGIRQVCDMAVFANTFGKEIDWETVFENCREIKAEVFAAAIFRIGEKYLGFDFKKAGLNDFDIETDETDLLLDLLSAGIYGGATMSRRHSSRMTLAAASKESKNKAPVLSSVFPSSKELLGKYPCLEKHPYLLPAIWVKRILGYVSEKKNRNDDSAREALKIGSRRTELLREYKIIE